MVTVAPDAFAALTLEPKVTLCARDECELTTPVVSAVDGSGNVVLGGLAAGLVLLDSSGHFVRRIGRFGAGPGEYRWAVAGDYDEAGIFTLFDSGNERLVSYDNAGVARTTSRVQMPPPIVDGAVVRGQDLYMFSIPAAEPGTDSVLGHILQYDRNGGGYDTIASMLVASIAETGSQFARVQPLFAAAPLWDVSTNGVVFFSPGSQYRIERLGPTGQISKVIVANVTTERVTAADVDREVNLRLGKSPPPPQFREQLNEAARNHARAFPAIDMLRLVDDSILWVRRFAPQWAPSARWDALTTAGVPHGTLMLPRRARILAGDRNKLLILDYDSLDVPIVGWYAVSSRRL